MIFFKTVCSGNDFIHIELGEKTRKQTGPNPDFIKQICHRRAGIGADGVVFFRIQESSVDFHVFNRDGAEAELSGNGMAGLASVVFSLNRSLDQITLNTRVGKRTVGMIERGNRFFRLSVEIGKPDFHNKQFFPFLNQERIKFSHKNIDFYPVSVGNPHAVVCLDHSKKLSDQKLQSLGETLSAAPIFPQGANIEIVEKEARDRFRIFFYERGAGATPSSSTGCAAVFAVLRKTEQINDHLQIDILDRTIKIYGEDDIFVENYCEMVYKGILLE